MAAPWLATSVLAVLLCVQALPARAGRAGVTLSPHSSDRRSLEGMFSGVGPSVRFVFSPSAQARLKPAAPPRRPAAPAVAFGPGEVPSYRFGGGLDAVLASLVDVCRDRVELVAPAFDFPKTAEAAVRAQRRGVSVRLITDYGQLGPGGRGGKTAELRSLIVSGAAVRTLFGPGPFGAMRGAFALLDGRLVETGSALFSETPRAHDAVLFRDEPALASGFQSYWRWLWAHAKPLSGLAAPFLEPGAFQEPTPSLRFKGRPWPAWAMPAQDASERLAAQAVGLCRERVDAVLPHPTRRFADALAAARREGARVRVVTDRAGDPGMLAALSGQGVEVYLFSGGGLLRAQFAWLDGELVEVGSAGEAGFGPAVFLSSPEDLKGFAAEFSDLLDRSSRL